MVQIIIVSVMIRVEFKYHCKSILIILRKATHSMAIIHDRNLKVRSNKEELFTEIHNLDGHH